MRTRIIGDAVLFAGAVALLGCGGENSPGGGSDAPEVGDACQPSEPQFCNEDDEVLHCTGGTWAVYVHSTGPESARCSCGNEDRPMRSVSCVSPGFVGVERSDRIRRGGERLRRVG